MPALTRQHGVGAGAPQSSSPSDRCIEGTGSDRRGSQLIPWDGYLQTVCKGLQKAQDLAARSDVVIESFRPAVMQRLGFDHAQNCPGGIVSLGLTER
ncbi:CoA transferase [Phaeobacter inhibens]|nr:CoA transferase [Phaeobacter inhibens]